MKIKLLSNDPARFESLSRTLRTVGTAVEISGGAGNPEDLAGFTHGSLPDVLVVDGATSRSLDEIERLGLYRPDLDIVVIVADPSPDFLLKAIRAGVREVVPASAPGEMLQGTLGRIVQRRRQAQDPGDQGGKVYAFLSCKGGSGATFVATNLAYALGAMQRRRVALIDLNLQFGDAAMLVSDRHPPSNVAEVAQQIHRLDASLLSSAMLEVLPDFGLLAAPEDPAHASDVRPEHVESILRLARRQYDAVLLDIPRTLDAVSLQALDMADTIFPVTQLSLPFIRDARRLQEVLRSLGYPGEKIRFIVNRHQNGVGVTLEDLERTLGQKVFRTIPNSYSAVATSVNLGAPIIKQHAGNPVSKALTEIAQALMPAPAEAQPAPGWLQRLLGSR